MGQTLAMPKGKETVILARIKSLNIAGLKFNKIADNLQDIWPGAKVCDVSDALKVADPDAWSQRAQFRLAAEEAKAPKKKAKPQKIYVAPRPAAERFWTAERDAYLTRRVEEKASASIIAAEMNIGRGMVSARAGKLGLKWRGAEGRADKLWPNEKVAQLRQLAAQGFNCAQLARRLGIPRERVRDKAAALGVDVQVEPLQNNLRGPHWISRDIRPAQPIVEHVAPRGGILFDDRQRDQCAFILGPVLFRSGGTKCCGAPIVEGEAHPYCQTHLERSRARYQPAEEMAA